MVFNSIGPPGYRKLPDGIRCRCINLFRTPDGSHWCCKPTLTTISMPDEVTWLAETETDILKRLRGNGWMVAAHNDYRQGGELFTFWLLTHQSGLWVKGEGRTDLESLQICDKQARKVFAQSP